jgi:hypothetical protein
VPLIKPVVGFTVTPAGSGVAANAVCGGLVAVIW